MSDRYHDQVSPEQIADVISRYKLPKEFILFLGNKAPKKNTKRTLLGYLHYASKTPDPIPIVVLDCTNECFQYLKSLEEG